MDNQKIQDKDSKLKEIKKLKQAYEEYRVGMEKIKKDLETMEAELNTSSQKN